MRRIVGLFLAFFLAFALIPAEASAAPNPEDTVRGFYTALLDVMQRGPDLGQKGRYDALVPAIHRSFDLATMARLAVGPTWTKLSPTQQNGVIAAFARYTTATYADRFNAYSGEQLQVTGAETAASGTVVRSRVVKSNGEAVRIDYLMHQSGNDWQIADVYLVGAVSELATLRAQFSSVLARDGVDGLVEMLNRKAAMPVASAS